MSLPYARYSAFAVLLLGACSAGDKPARGGPGSGGSTGSGGTNSLGSTGRSSLIGTGAGGTFSAVCGQGGTKTTVSGTVYDPAGKVPLYNVVLYVALTSDLTPIPEGPSCEAYAGRTAQAAADPPSHLNSRFD